MPSIPFVVGQWVRGERFYGRTALIEEVFEGHRNWLWLLGTRRIGKTSLLKQLESLASSAATNGSGFVPIFWDFQGADAPDELHRGFREALLDAEDRLEKIGIRLDDLEGVDLFDSLGRLRRKVRLVNRRLLLLCDEVEELIKLDRKDPALLRKLRRSLQSQEDIRSVLASSIRLWALAEQETDTSPFLHGFTPPLYISRLEDEEARSLIRQSKLPSASRPPIGEEVVEEIRSRCDNHPYLMQLVCKRYLELQSLGDAIEQVASDQMVSHFFSVDFEMLSPAERDVVRIIAETSASSSNSLQTHLLAEAGELTRVLQQLERLGYLRRNSERKFELVNHFFKRWFSELPSAAKASATGLRPVSRSPLSEESTKSLQPAANVLFDGRYRLMQEIGKGATGVVYKAYDETLRDTIAIKILKQEYTEHTELLERFRQEILLTRNIGHPNILRVYHLGETDHQVYLTMMLVDGPTLAASIRRDGALPIGRTVDTSWKLASALEAAHGKHVIHRDIKPQNVFMSREGEPYLGDFGLARLLTGPGFTRGGVFLGTPDYSSPEQASAQRTDERSDIYSVGVMIFEMSTGKRPFRGESAHDVLEMHKTAPPPDPRRIRTEIPPSLSRLILLCLEKDPGRRCQSARALRQALEELRKNY